MKFPDQENNPDRDLFSAPYGKFMSAAADRLKNPVVWWNTVDPCLFYEIPSISWITNLNCGRLNQDPFFPPFHSFMELWSARYHPSSNWSIHRQL